MLPALLRPPLFGRGVLVRGVVGVGVPLFCALLGVVLLLLLERLEGRGVEVVVGPVDDRLDWGFDLAEWRLPVDSEETRFYFITIFFGAVRQTIIGAIQVLRNTFFCKLDTHQYPRNVNNVEPYFFITLFSGRSDTPIPYCAT